MWYVVLWQPLMSGCILKTIILFFSNSAVEKRGLSALQRSKAGTLREEWALRKMPEKLKFSKTAIHQAIARFKKFGSFQH